METITDDQALDQYMHEPNQSQPQDEVKSPWDHSPDMEEPDLRVDLRDNPRIVSTIGYERINRPPADASTPAGGISLQALKFQVTHNDADGNDPRLFDQYPHYFYQAEDGGFFRCGEQEEKFFKQAIAKGHAGIIYTWQGFNWDKASKLYNKKYTDYEVDLFNMTQKNRSTGVTRNLLRINSNGSPFRGSSQDYELVGKTLICPACLEGAPCCQDKQCEYTLQRRISSEVPRYGAIIDTPGGICRDCCAADQCRWKPTCEQRLDDADRQEKLGNNLSYLERIEALRRTIEQAEVSILQSHADDTIDSPQGKRARVRLISDATEAVAAAHVAAIAPDVHFVRKVQ